jgi:hypothetical protein
LFSSVLDFDIVVSRQRIRLAIALIFLRVEITIFLGSFSERNAFFDYDFFSVVCGGEFFRIQPFQVTGVIRVARERHYLTAEQPLAFLVELCLGVIPERI